MMRTQNTGLMFSRPSLKGFFWLGLFVFQSNSIGVVQMTEVKAKVGGVAKLPCGYNIHSDNPLKRYGVYWQKFVGKGQTDQVALSYWEGKKDKIDPIYQNRTTMDQRNLTLWISSVKVSDEGKYTCLILKDPLYRRELYLSVEADFSNPIINVTRHACGSALVTLRCSSYGGYPKPNMSGLLNNKEVEWTPHSVSDNQTELINITSEWEHNVTEDIFFQCTVSYPGFSASASCTIPKECPVVKPPSHWIMIAVSVSLACAVVVAALANIQRCKRHRSLCCTRSHQPVARSEVNMGGALTPLQFSSGTP